MKKYLTIILQLLLINLAVSSNLFNINRFFSLENINSNIDIFYDADIDTDGDGIPDDIDTDDDNDGVLDVDDCAPLNKDFFYESAWYADSDGDGYGNLETYVLTCIQPDGYVNNSDDCDDTNQYVHGIPDLPNVPKITQNCENTEVMFTSQPNGVTYYWQETLDDISTTDFNLSKTFYNDTVIYIRAKNTCGWSASSIIVNVVINRPKLLYADNDGDGYGDFYNYINDCEQQGYVLNHDDPNDNNATITPLFLHYIKTESWNLKGELIGKSIQYANDMSKILQSQTYDVINNRRWATQTIYDEFGRAAIKTLSAPVGAGSIFSFEENFLDKTNGTDYTYDDFISRDFSTATKLNSNRLNTLGYYYSNNNTDNTYQSTTSYPFTRTFYDDNRMGANLTSFTAGDENRIGIGKGDYTYSFTMRAGQELYYLMGMEYFGKSGTGWIDGAKILKTVSRGPMGKEAIVYKDLEGKVLATARSSSKKSVSNNEITVKHAFSNETEYYDIHIPYTTNEKQTISLVTSIPNGEFKILNLIDDTDDQSNIYIGSTDIQLYPGYYRVFFNKPEEYLITNKMIFNGDNFDDPDFKIDNQNETIINNRDILSSTCFLNCDYQAIVLKLVNNHLIVNVNLNITVGRLKNGFIKYINKDIPNMKIGDILNDQYTLYIKDGALYLGGYSSILLPKTHSEIFDIDLSSLFDYALVEYKINYTDWSLNYYDKAGRLKKSIPPLGVDPNYDSAIVDYPNHNSKLTSTFTYNSLGWLLSSTSPDEGISKYFYRKDGQIRFSQNSQQVIDNKFSYTKYDYLGRAIESGVINESGSYTFSNSETNVDNDNWTDSASKDEVSITLYDLKKALPPTLLNNYKQKHVAGAVSYTKNNNNETWYSYDIQGRVTWIVQNISELGLKTLDYKYDVNGKVTNVYYQKNVANEYFEHKYFYNIVGKMDSVSTSLDGISYTKQAEYIYNDKGQLKRTILANGLQGIDYVYTLDGKLKAINSPNMDGNTSGFLDPGNDNNDIFGMILEYYDGDYQRNGVNLGSINTGINRYDGNIKNMIWNTRLSDDNNPQNQQVYTYDYDDRNWLKKAVYGLYTEAISPEENIVFSESVVGGQSKTIIALNSITLDNGFNVEVGSTFNAIISSESETAAYSSADNDAYKVDNLTYDSNGNIKTLNRNATNNNGYALEMDSLSYSYDPWKPNQLVNINDTGSLNDMGDIKNQEISYNNKGVPTYNYKYNRIGQLISDLSKGRYYTYNASGLVTAIYTDSVHTNKRVEFIYNERGHRIKKIDYGTIIKITHYALDASGNVMAIYENNTQKELPLYGASRLGVLYKDDNTSVYEITDHLGNVRATIAKNTSDPNIGLDVKSYADYYPFGMKMPGKFGGSGYRYAYQGQEKDNETGFEAFELRQWDGRIGRWMSTDPYGQDYSTYGGMGNNPVNRVDLDGGWTGDPPDGEKPIFLGMLNEIVVADYASTWSSEVARYGFNGTLDQWQSMYGMSGDWNEWYNEHGDAWYSQVAIWDQQEMDRITMGKLRFFVDAFEAISYVAAPTTALNTYTSLAKSSSYSVTARGVGFKTYSVSSSAPGTGNPANARINYMVNGGTKIKSTYFTNRRGDVIFQIDNAQHGIHAPGHGHRMSIPGNLGSGHANGHHISAFNIPFRFRY